MSVAAVRQPPEIRGLQERKFAELMRNVLESNRFYQQKYEELGFANARPVGLSDRDRIPLVQPVELFLDVERDPPAGTNLTHRLSRYTRMHHAFAATGEPLRWLDTADSWDWWLSCWRTVYGAAGVAADDRVFVVNADGSAICQTAAFEAGQQLGALMISGGPAGLVDRLDTLFDSRATVVVASASDARSLVDDARCRGRDPAASAVRALIQNCGSLACLADDETAGVPEGWPEQRFFQIGAIEIGAWGYTCGHSNHLHVNEEEFIAEVLNPTSHQRAEVDEQGLQRGELVLTNLGRIGSPLIRYATGQIVELSRPACACGRKTAVVRCLSARTACR